MKVIDSKPKISAIILLRKLGEGSRNYFYLTEDKKHIVKLFNHSFNERKVNPK